jgi:hypothetical protein
MANFSVKWEFWGIFVHIKFINEAPCVLSCAFFSGVASIWPLSYKAQFGKVL